MHFFYIGIGGDGLCGPQEGLVNPRQKFLAHTDAPEVWRDGVLVDGGRPVGCGVYLVELQAGARTDTAKITLAR